MDEGNGRPLAEPITPRGTTAAGEANVERILDAALGVFGRYGFQGARIDRIAEAAGMSKTNLLYYFRSKSALYLAVLTRTLELWLEPLRAFDAARDPAEALTDYITRKLEYSRDQPEASRLFAIEIMQGAPILGEVLAGDLARLFHDKVGIIETWIAEGRLAPVDPRHLVFGVWATTQHYADFAVQIEALTGRTLAEARFFDDTRQALLTLLVHPLCPLRQLADGS